MSPSNSGAWTINCKKISSGVGPKSKRKRGFSASNDSMRGPNLDTKHEKKELVEQNFSNERKTLQKDGKHLLKRKLTARMSKIK